MLNCLHIINRTNETKPNQQGWANGISFVDYSRNKQGRAV